MSDDPIVPQPEPVLPEDVRLELERLSRDLAWWSGVLADAAKNDGDVGWMRNSGLQPLVQTRLMLADMREELSKLNRAAGKTYKRVRQLTLPEVSK